MAEEKEALLLHPKKMLKKEATPETPEGEPAKDEERHIWYVLAMPDGDGYEYYYDDAQPVGDGDERFEFETLEEAKEAQVREQDCCDAVIGILEETRRWIN